MKKYKLLFLFLLSFLVAPNLFADDYLRLYASLDSTDVETKLYEITIDGNDTTYTEVQNTGGTTCASVTIASIGITYANKKDVHTFSFGNPGEIWFDVNTEDVPSTATYALAQDGYWGIGLSLGDKFRAYPNPNIYGADRKVYNYYLRIRDVSTGTGKAKTQAISSYNLYKLVGTISSSNTKIPSGIDVVKYANTSGVSNTTAYKYIAYFSSETGDANQYISLPTSCSTSLVDWNKTTTNSYVKTGASVGVMISSIEMFIDDGAAKQPADALLTNAPVYDEENEIYRFISSATVKPTTDTDLEFSAHKYVYYFGEEALTDEAFQEKYEADELTKIEDGESITITEKGVLSIASIGVDDSGTEGELIGNVMTYTFEPYEHTAITAYSEFAEDHDGKLVSIDFPLNLYGSYTGASATTSRTIYGRDLTGHVVKISASAATDVLASWTDFGDLDDPDARTYAPAGTFKGIYNYNSGHPEIIVATTTYDYSPCVPAKDEAALTGDAALTEIADDTELFAEYGGGVINRINGDYWGCIVTIKGAISQASVEKTATTGYSFKYSGNIISFTPKKLYAADILTTEGARYDITGIIERYSSTSSSYIISPLSVSAIPDVPTLSVSAASWRS